MMSTRSSWPICRASVARTRLVWHKQPMEVPEPGMSRGDVHRDRTRRIASPAAAITDRAGRWATLQVGRHGRSVREVAADLGCDWHTVMDAVDRLRRTADRRPGQDRRRRRRSGLDEVLFCTARPVPHEALVDPDRRRRHTASCSTSSLAVTRLGRAPGSPQRPEEWLTGDPMGDAGSVGSVSQRVRHDAPRTPPRSPIRSIVIQLANTGPRRGPPPRAERHVRSPRPPATIRSTEPADC